MRYPVFRFPNRGGNRNNAGHAGLGALNLNNERTNANNNIGLRLSRLTWPEGSRLPGAAPVPSNGCMILGRVPKKPKPVVCGTSWKPITGALNSPTHKDAA